MIIPEKTEKNNKTIADIAINIIFFLLIIFGKRYASFTIPYLENGRVVSIRHRLKGKESDKYRPEFAGLGNRVFNGDRLTRDDSFMPASPTGSSHLFHRLD